MKIRYIGTSNYQEYPVTGTNALWQPEWVSDVSDSRATALVALGTFVYEDDSTYAKQLLEHAAEHVAMGSVPVVSEDVNDVRSFVVAGDDQYLTANLTFAQMTALSAASYPRLTVYVSDVGIGGSYWYSDGTRWRAVGGKVALGVTKTVSSGTANQVIGEAILPPGLLKDGDILSIFWSGLKSSTSQTATIGSYIGTTSGTVGVNLNIGTSGLATTNIRCDALWQFVRLSATSIQGVSIAGTVGYGAAATDTAAATSGNLDSVTQYIQLCCSFAAGTETVTLRDLEIAIHTRGA